jgi:hypothetical protein
LGVWSIGGQGHVAVGMAGAAGNGTLVDAAGDQLGDHEMP